MIVIVVGGNGEVMIDMIMWYEVVLVVVDVLIC